MKQIDDIVVLIEMVARKESAVKYGSYFFYSGTSVSSATAWYTDKKGNRHDFKDSDLKKLKSRLENLLD